MYLFHLLTYTLGVQMLIWGIKGILKYKHEKELIILYALTIVSSLGIAIISAWVIGTAGN